MNFIQKRVGGDSKGRIAVLKMTYSIDLLNLRRSWEGGGVHI